MKSAWSYVTQDVAANRGYPKSQLVVVAFRISAYSKIKCTGPPAKLLRVFIAACYKLATEWVLGVELPATTPIGPGLRLRHGVGLVVNPYSQIGSNVLVRQGVTIGNKRESDDCPVIADDVEIGAGAVVVGPITIGKGAKIGPLAYVDFDVREGSIVVSQRSAAIRSGNAGA
ncbi:serine acetyltransferase [Gordonia oleivorans]|uniref:serine acetyltransferase n=1 Tax=Gordonia oleivorans TaxID=3156618 RepID=UPI003CCDA2CC